jgi:hypothetical protein
MTEQERLKLLTNEEFMSELMNFSPFGGVVQAFVVEAMAYYCEEVINQEGVVEDPKALISISTWRAVAKDVLGKINAKYDREPTR